MKNKDNNSGNFVFIAKVVLFISAVAGYIFNVGIITFLQLFIMLSVGLFIAGFFPPVYRTKSEDEKYSKD